MYRNILNVRIRWRVNAVRQLAIYGAIEVLKGRAIQSKVKIFGLEINNVV